jgi:hypothetical protein
MTLAEFLADPEAWLGREVVIDGGWLHCDSRSGVFLDAGPVFERRLVVVRSLWVGKWVHDHIPPRPGAPTPYMFPASVRGTVQPRPTGSPPVLAGELYITLRYEGQLHLRGPGLAPPVRVSGSRSAGVASPPAAPDAEPGAAADGGGM